jgi:hypothetical protein
MLDAKIMSITAAVAIDKLAHVIDGWMDGWE